MISQNHQAGPSGYAAPIRVRRPSVIPRLVVSLVLLAVALVLLISGGLTVADRFANPFSAPYQSGDFTQRLQTGTYLVFATEVANVRDTPADLKVTAPDHSSVVVSAYTGTYSQTRGGQDYNAYAQFDAATAGTYSFSLATTGPPRIIVARTLVNSIKPLIRPGIEAVVGAVLAIIGLTVLIRTYTRRRWPFAGGQPPPWFQPGPAAPWPQPNPAASWPQPNPAAPWPQPGSPVGWVPPPPMTQPPEPVRGTPPEDPAEPPGRPGTAV